MLTFRTEFKHAVRSSQGVAKCLAFLEEVIMSSAPNQFISGYSSHQNRASLLKQSLGKECFCTLNTACTTRTTLTLPPYRAVGVLLLPYDDRFDCQAASHLRPQG
jgi:hypothetical protein